MISSVRASPAFATPLFNSTVSTANGPAFAKTPAPAGQVDQFQSGGKTPAPTGKAPAPTGKAPASPETIRWKVGTKVGGKELSYEVKKVLEPGKPPAIQITVVTPRGTLQLRSDQPPPGYPAAKWADTFRRIFEAGQPSGDLSKLWGPVADDAMDAKSGEIGMGEFIDNFAKAALNPKLHVKR